MLKLWNKRKIILVLLLVVAFLVVPVLAVRSADEEDYYQLKPEWKGKHMVKEEHGELTRVVFLLTPLGDPDVDGNQDAYEMLDYWWSTSSLPVEYAINPKTPVKEYGLTESAVIQAVQESFEAWDAHSSLEFFDAPKVKYGGRASIERPDLKNLVTWGRISSNSVVAVTTVWYYTDSKQVIDADIVFNTYFTWGIDLDGEGTGHTLPDVIFDIQDIGTHETGHVCSLGDLYEEQYGAMTMYGYGSGGEVYKRSLEYGDIAGLNAAYP